MLRAAASSLSDLEVKLNKAIERNVILGIQLILYRCNAVTDVWLENEIAVKDDLMEQTQRLKDELNGKIGTIDFLKYC